MDRIPQILNFQSSIFNSGLSRLGRVYRFFNYKISGSQQRWPRPLPGAILIPPALLVVADFRKTHFRVDGYGGGNPPVLFGLVVFRFLNGMHGLLF